jgi:four helix bundle protein
MARLCRDLIVWQKAMMLTEATCSAALALPALERFGLCARLRRPSVSIPSDIAEGDERRSRAEYRRFIAIAWGSLAELETQLDLSRRLHRIDAQLIGRASAMADEVGRLPRSIERSLRVRAIEEAAIDSAPQPSALAPRPFE